MFARLRTIARTVIRGERGDRIRSVWRISVPLIAGLGTFTGTFVAALAVGAPTGMAALVAWVTTALVVLGVVRTSARYLDRRPLSEYGYRISHGWWLDLVAGVALGSLVIVLTLLIAFQLGSARLPDEGSVVGSVSLPWLATFLIGLVGVAFWEELVFRGVVVTNAIEGLGERGCSRSAAEAAALIGSAAVFAVVHVPGALAEGGSPWSTALWTFSAGLLFGVAYLLTGELALPMGLHLGINYVSGNVFGIAGIAAMEGVPTVFVVESTATGLAAPMSGIPILVSIGVGCALVAGWCYWRQGTLESALNHPQSRTEPGRDTSV